MRNAIFAMLVCALSSIAAAQVMVVRAGRLVDPDSGTVLTDQVIVLNDGKIQAVGKGFGDSGGGEDYRSFKPDGIARVHRLPHASRRWSYGGEWRPVQCGEEDGRTNGSWCRVKCRENFAFGIHQRARRRCLSCAYRRCPARCD